MIDYIHDCMNRTYYSAMDRDKRYEGVETDKSVKFCPECRRCFEDYRIAYGWNKKGQVYLKDFPSWGKEKKICKNCSNGS